MPALGSANAVDSMFNGALTGVREQTVCTPDNLLIPMRAFFGGRVRYDPCHAPSSNVDPVEGHIVDWEGMWLAAEVFMLESVTTDLGLTEDEAEAVAKVAVTVAAELVPARAAQAPKAAPLLGENVAVGTLNAMLSTNVVTVDGEEATERVTEGLLRIVIATDLLFCLKRSSKKDKARDAAAKKRHKLAQKLRKATEKHLRSVYGATSGHMQAWKRGTFVNPPYGDKGPYTILGGFRQFCLAFHETTAESIMLCPNRSHRKWWRKHLLLSADAICYLDPVKFVGYPQSFPAPLVLAYRGNRPEEFAAAFAHLGDTVIRHKPDESSVKLAS